MPRPIKKKLPVKSKRPVKKAKKKAVKKKSTKPVKSIPKKQSKAKKKVVSKKQVKKPKKQIKKPKRKRRSQVELDLIYREIVELVLMGNPRPDILQFITKKHKVSSRQFDNYISEARKKIAEIYKESDANLILQSAAFYDRLKRKAEKNEDYRTALRAEQAKVKLFGLNQPTRHTFEGTGEGGGFEITIIEEKPKPEKKEKK